MASQRKPLESLKIVERKLRCATVKGSSDPSHFFEINVGKRRSRHATTLKLNDEFLDQLKIEWRFKFRVVICRIRLFPTLTSKIKRLWYELHVPLKYNMRWAISAPLQCQRHKSGHYCKLLTKSVINTNPKLLVFDLCLIWRI